MPTEQNAVDELTCTLSWFEDRSGGTALNEKNLRPMLSFLLLWSLFERETFDERRKQPRFFQRLVEAVQQNPLGAGEDIISPLLSYFRHRYISDDGGEEKLAQLNLEPKSNGLFGEETAIEYVKRILRNENASQNDKLTCVFVIIYRFRNNLFHGRKQPIALNSYKTPFIKINCFLRQYLSLPKEISG